jgi:hypothetical protein
MLSSLNHHLSILKLTVHETYLDSLATGTQASNAERGWQRPRLQRSKWFDIFNCEQRIEAFRCLWGVMAYLTRDDERLEDSANGDATMTGT